jgi:xanthine/uracil/vitamin C permease (AzgA family)
MAACMCSLHHMRMPACKCHSFRICAAVSAGINAYFAYSVVGFMSTGMVSGCARTAGLSDSCSACGTATRLQAHKSTMAAAAEVAQVCDPNDSSSCDDLLLCCCCCCHLQITYQEALAAVFVEGWIFILISLTGGQTLFLGTGAAAVAGIDKTCTPDSSGCMPSSCCSRSIVVLRQLSRRQPCGTL